MLTRVAANPVWEHLRFVNKITDKLQGDKIMQTINKL